MVKKGQFPVKQENKQKAIPLSKADIINNACEQIATSEQHICNTVNDCVKDISDLVRNVTRSMKLDYAKEMQIQQQKLEDTLNTFSDNNKKAFDEQIRRFNKSKTYQFTLVFLCGVFFMAGIMMMITAGNKIDEMRNQKKTEKPYTEYGRWVFDHTGGQDSKLFKKYREERTE